MKRKVLIMMMGAALMWVLAGCAEYGSAAEPHKDTPSEITVAETVPETVFSVAETPDIAAEEGSTYTETSAQYEDPADLSDSTPAAAEEDTEVDKKAETSHGWTCEKCGADNTGMFCLTCGEAGPSFGKVGRRDIWPEDGHIPTLVEVRKKEEQHGPLIEVEWSGSSSGMMMGSISKYSMRLFRENDEVRLVDMDMKTYGPVITRTYAVDDGILDKFERIIEKDNLAAWGHIKVDQDKRMIVYDYSSSSFLNLVFDDRGSGDGFLTSVSIDGEAVSQQGGDEVWHAVVSLLKECIDPDQILFESTEPNPYTGGIVPGSGFPGFGTIDPAARNGNNGTTAEGDGTSVIAEDGSWTCGTCGATGNTGKFCPECGSRRPQ